MESGSEEEGDGNSDGGSGNTISDEKLEEAIENGSVGNGSSNDDGSDAVELSDRQKEMLRKAFEKQEKFLDGDVQKTKLSKKDNNSVKAIEESGATYENVGDGISVHRWSNISGKGTKCLVVKNLTQV